MGLVNLRSQKCGYNAERLDFISTSTTTNTTTMAAAPPIPKIYLDALEKFERYAPALIARSQKKSTKAFQPLPFHERRRTSSYVRVKRQPKKKKLLKKKGGIMNWDFGYTLTLVD